MTLAVVRHGETAWNAQRLMQGRSDVALNDSGRSQSLFAGEILRAQGSWRAVVSSPLVRARQTAEIIADVLGADLLAADPDLIERGFGDAEGRQVDEVAQLWPDGAYPNSEPADVAAQRAAHALMRWSVAGDVVVVAHGVLLRGGIATLTGTPYPRILNGQVIGLRHDPHGWSAELLDAVSEGSRSA